MKRISVISGLLLACLIGLAVPYVTRHLKADTRQTSANADPAPLTHASGAVKPILFVANPEAAPAFEARDIAGPSLSTADWKGKVVLLAFWATWCPPCREEIPTFIELQAKYKDRLQIIGVSEDDDPPEKVLQFARQKGINYPIIMATPDLIAKYGGVPALPTAFLIDTQGRVVQKHVGLSSFDLYDREVRALLGLPVDAPIQTFVDNGQVFLKNAANATELPGVKLAGLTPAQKKTVLHRLNAESCTCGCMLTLSECRINDTTCPVSQDIAAHVVSDVTKVVKPKPATSPAS